MPGVLVTRPLPQAEETAQRLRRLGYTPILSPMLRIEAVAAAPDLSDAQAILFTSTNGVRAFAAASAERALPVFTVGDRTAIAAREARFETVASADGDAAALAALVLARTAPGGGKILHARGEYVAHSPLPTLDAQGYATREAILYRAAPADRLSNDARAALETNVLSAVTVYSQRTAQALAALLPSDAVAALALVGLSENALAPLAALPFRSRRAAREPTEAALFDALAVDAPLGQR